MRATSLRRAARRQQAGDEEAPVLPRFCGYFGLEMPRARRDDSAAAKSLRFHSADPQCRSRFDLSDPGTGIPAGSATARALAGEPVPSAGHFENGTTAGFWFPFTPKGGFRDEILIKQAIPLGQFGVLTFLYPKGGVFPWA